MTNINLWKIMAEEVDIINNQINEDLEDITENHPYGLPPIMIMKPEKERDYSIMSEEEIYRELVGIHIRGRNIFSRIDKDYMKSAIKAYDKIIPFIKDSDIVKHAKFFREWTCNSLSKLEESGEGLRKFTRKIRETKHH